jgi:uncharacterized protein with gpF-like domain
MLKLFFTLLAAIIKAVVQIISALAGLLKKKQPHTSKQATFRIGSGRQIYEGLKKEYAGPTGKTAKKYFLECCARTAITSNLSPQLLNYIRSENLKGRRAESIATSVLRKLPCYGKEDVERMVRSVVGMAETAFDRARAEDLGLEWYTWSTCCDARVRDSHRNMEGVLVSWNDPPSPEELIGDASQGKYHAGEGEECRCDARSILGLDGINWPARVHRNGRIVSMNRKDFQRLSGIQ